MNHARSRVKLLDKIMEDENVLPVAEVAEIFSGILKGLSEHSKTFNQVKNKATNDEWIAFIHGLANSFLSSVYVTASTSESQLKERLEECKNINSDLLISVDIIDEEIDKKNIC